MPVSRGPGWGRWNRAQGARSKTEQAETGEIKEEQATRAKVPFDPSHHWTLIRIFYTLYLLGLLPSRNSSYICLCICYHGSNTVRARSVETLGSRYMALTNPTVTTKNSDTGSDERYMYGVSEMQGWRMEDAHTTVLKLDSQSNNAFFAVFDGHGGSTVAKYAGSHVHERLKSDAGYQSKDYKGALKRAFLGTDDDLRADPAFFHDPSGCTAVAALLTENKILVVSSKSSVSTTSPRILVSGCSRDPLFSCTDLHSTAETARITAAGGYVEFNRVNGNLALSRAIGDFEFKQNYAIQPEQQIVTSNPDITEHDITDEDEFIILACDGIWDCLTSQQVVDCVRRLAAEKKSLGEICETIMDRCVAPDSDIGAGIGCDNMTIMVVAILNVGP
ncbi:protein phosphatase type 2C [Rhizoctonia solani AG-1 IA]|uniref:protein-serine/threonine phosphatase n=1 Tax=Thanatephorus cucumeris (strain AG1-IA) TaxID=983506 RepID=L8X6Z7_THACA|nr:protein phosphatase type 2C [Rhizoctonia solani AG-1 IA]